MGGVANPVCIVTGAAGAIGTGIWQKLLHSGYRLALADAARESALTGDQLRDGDRGFCAQLDVTDEGAVAAFVERVESDLGPVENLVNVAGVQRLGLLVDLAEFDFAATFDVNVRGVFNVTRSVARRMMQRGRGAIVTIASNASRVPRVRQGAYCASKAAVAHLMRVFALELAPHGIRVNSVSPGATDTPMIERLMADMKFADELLRGSLSNFRVGTPLGKNASVEDVANAVAFLLSDQASHITMQELVVDGGAALGA